MLSALKVNTLNSALAVALDLAELDQEVGSRFIKNEKEPYGLT